MTKKTKTTKPPRPQWLLLMCAIEGCTWKRRAVDHELPTVPHAAHFMDTGHDKVTTYKSKTRPLGALNDLSAEELHTAKIFSAGV